MTNLRFPRAEKLKSRVQIARVFSHGSGLFKYPVKAIILVEEDQSRSNHLEVAFSVPKKRIKKAVQRNLIKRRMKEAYRLHRKVYLSPAINKENKLNFSILFIFQANVILDYRTIEKAMLKLLKRIAEAN